MKATADATALNDQQEQIRQLQARLDALMSERIEPAFRAAADEVEDAAAQIGRAAQDELDALARQVRERPLTSLLLAAAAGFLVARLSR